MKKTAIFLLFTVLLCAFLAACTPEAPEIGDYKWSLASASTDDRGIVTLEYVSEKYVQLFKEGEDLPRINCTLRARRGEFTLTDTDSGKKYYGTYDSAEEMSPDATAYEITLEGRRGRALVMRAADSDGDDFYTLSISVGNYNLFFIR